MLSSKKLKKMMAVLLMINLMYANFSMTISGMISYAIDEEKMLQDISKQDEVYEKQKSFEIQLSEFCKDNMTNQETEYQEKIKLNLEFEQNFDEIVLNDVNTVISNSEESEDEEQKNKEIKTFYKTTKIVKDELIKVISENGSLEIKYSVEDDENKEEIEVIEENKNLEQENLTETDENLIILPEEENIEQNNTGKIFAKDGKVTISAETTADEEGYITVIYPEKTYKVDLEILKNLNKTSELLIINNKVIDTVENVEEVNLMQVTKQIIVKGENDLLNTIEMTEMPINYSRTFAELGIDKTQISTGIENKVNFTITLHTEKEIFNLYTNPSFVIELPKEVKNINIDEAFILNNTYIESSSMEITTLENGNKALLIKFEGTQTEYTNSIQENIQIAISARVITEEFIPTIQEQINLYYTNENATTYNGVEKEENGFQNIAIELVSNKEVMIESKVLFGEQVISSRENQNTIAMKPNSYENVTMIGTVINNVGIDIQNAKILGNVTNMGPVSGVEKVYYTENSEANVNIEDLNNNWTETYTPNAKKFLIILDEFKQAQTVNFGYYMYLPQNCEDDVELEASYEIYDNNNQILNVSRQKILQEARKFDIYEDEQIKTQIMIEKEDIIVGDIFEGTIEITNKTNEIISGMEIDINLPENLKRINTTIESNGENVKAYIQAESNLLIAKDININSNSTVVVKLAIKANEINELGQKLIANISYNNKAESIFDRVKIIEKPQTKIEALISSNKSNRTLEANEDVEYKITLINSGNEQAKVDIIMSELENLLITKMQSINITTGETTTITSGDLEGKLLNISINAGEKVEICVVAVAKMLEDNETEVIYANIVGDNIEEVTTNKIINTIKKEQEEEITVETTSVNDEKELGTITGVAWIDENENGQKDTEEKLLTDIEAVLINTKTSEEVAKEITNDKGEYIFDNIPEENYVVIFKYNKDDFSVTNYTNKNFSNNLESNIVNTTQNNETIAKTEVIELKDGNTENINAGFITNKKPDIKMNSKINKITVCNDNGITSYNFEKSKIPQIVKLDNSKQEEMTLVEYEFKIVNNGEAEGYINPITQQIPEGMKFVSELNTDWYEGNDGNVYSSTLINQKLQPGEKIIIKLILTKEQTNK